MLQKFIPRNAAIFAERFDGSVVMKQKYGIHEAKVPNMVTDLNLYLPTKEGDAIVGVGDWIATGIDYEHWVIANDIFRRTYERCD